VDLHWLNRLRDLLGEDVIADQVAAFLDGPSEIALLELLDRHGGADGREVSVRADAP